MAFTVPFAEMEGSPQEAWTADAFRATVRVTCGWDVRNTLAWEFFANGYYPRIPATKALPRTVTVQPHPGRQLELAPGYADYESAILTVEYDNQRGEEEDEEDPSILIAESLEPNVEFLTQDPEGLYWDELGIIKVAENEAPGKLIRSLDYKVTLYGIRTIPAAVLSLIGCVNDATISCKRLGLTFAAETLLYQPPTTNRQIKTDGAEAWTLNYRFSYRPSGWNKFWRRATWASLYEKDEEGTVTPYKAYPTGNLSQLLRW